MTHFAFDRRPRPVRTCLFCWAALAAVVFAGTFSCGGERNFRDAEDGDTSASGAGGTGGNTDGGTGGSTDDGSADGDGGIGGSADGNADGGTGGSIEEAGSGGNAGGTSLMGGQTSTGDPESCSSDDDCPVSGACRISYVDKDGDGYGHPDVSTGRCDGTIPANFTALSGDCCDDGGDLELAAKINPGQETYFDTTANICGIAWDYNCSSEVERSPERLSTGCANPGDTEACEKAYKETTEDDCGETKAGGYGCALSGAPTRTCSTVGQTGILIECH